MPNPVDPSAKTADVLDLNDLVALVTTARELTSEVHLPRPLHRILAQATHLRNAHSSEQSEAFVVQALRSLTDGEDDILKSGRVLICDRDPMEPYGCGVP
jgi:hypothetical protein